MGAGWCTRGLVAAGDARGQQSYSSGVMVERTVTPERCVTGARPTTLISVTDQAGGDCGLVEPETSVHHDGDDDCEATKTWLADRHEKRHLVANWLGGWTAWATCPPCPVASPSTAPHPVPRLADHHHRRILPTAPASVQQVLRPARRRRPGRPPPTPHPGLITLRPGFGPTAAATRTRRSL